ncbi:IS5 family transposase [Larkinella arboricola]
MELSDKQWDKIKELVPDGPRRSDGRGRPWQDKRKVLEGVIWILRTGAPWKDLPAHYPPYQTCHRRFQQWQQTGVFEQIITTLARDLHQRGGIDLSECFVDGTFCMAKKGALLVGKTKRGKGTKIMAITDASGVLLSVSVHRASPHEVTLVEQTIEGRLIDPLPQRLIGDKAYDSDPLDDRLKMQGIELIAPHKANRVKPKTQDGRKLRRYRRRWKIERFFAWLFNYRRMVVRYEYKAENFVAMLLLACAMLFLKAFFHL